MFVKENSDKIYIYIYIYIYVQLNEEIWVAMDSVRLDMIIVAICCYLGKEI